MNEIYAHTEGYVVSVTCEGRGRFRVTPQQIGVEWKGGTHYNHYLATLPLALWLEFHDVPCLHANALAIDDEYAIGLVAPSQGGKSTLSAALLQHGAALMTDDMLALHERESSELKAGAAAVFPAMPTLRLWPSAIANLFGDDQQHPRVHDRFEKREVAFGSDDLVESPRTLRALFLLDRVEESAHKHTEIKRISSAEALIHILGHSILGDAYSTLGLEESRIATLGHYLKSIEVYRVRYRSGFDDLPRVAEMILETARN